jgi:hypothetical protein
MYTRLVLGGVGSLVQVRSHKTFNRVAGELLCPVASETRLRVPTPLVASSAPLVYDDRFSNRCKKDASEIS